MGTDAGHGRQRVCVRRTNLNLEITRHSRALAGRVVSGGRPSGGVCQIALSGLL
jgi:hypothetical protein